MDYKTKQNETVDRNLCDFLTIRKNIPDSNRIVYSIEGNEELIKNISILEEHPDDIVFIKALSYIEDEFARYPIPDPIQLAETSLINSLFQILSNPCYKNPYSRERERALNIIQKLAVTANKPDYPLLSFEAIETMMNIAKEDSKLFHSVNLILQSIFTNKSFDNENLYALIEDTPFLDAFCSLFVSLPDYKSINSFIETMCIIIDVLVVVSKPFPPNFLKKIDFLLNILDRSQFVDIDRLSTILVHLTNFTDVKGRLKEPQNQRIVRNILINGTSNTFKAALILAISASPDELLSIYYNDQILEKVNSYMFVCDEKGAESISLYFNAIFRADHATFTIKVLNILMHGFENAPAKTRFVFIHDIIQYALDGMFTTIIDKYPDEFSDAVTLICESLGMFTSEQLHFFINSLMTLFPSNVEKMNEIFNETDIFSIIDDIQNETEDEDLRSLFDLFLSMENLDIPDGD